MPDFYHWSDKGCQLWADTVEEPLKELMGAK
jgi:activator of HSP90 ATPase